MSKFKDIAKLFAGRHFDRDTIVLCVRWYLRYTLSLRDPVEGMAERAASHRAVREMKADGVLPEDIKVRSSKYLNKVIEQDHRNVKSRTSVMLGFKRSRNAVSTLAGIELVHRICKGQFDLAKLRLKDTTTPTVSDAVLAA